MERVKRDMNAIPKNSSLLPAPTMKFSDLKVNDLFVHASGRFMEIRMKLGAQKKGVVDVKKIEWALLCTKELEQTKIHSPVYLVKYELGEGWKVMIGDEWVEYKEGP